MPIFGPDSLRLEAFANYLLLGASSTGKSVTAIDILLNRESIFTKTADKVIYFYKSDQELFKKAQATDPSIKFVNSKESFENELTATPYTHCICVIDDQLIDTLTTEKAFIIDLFTRRAHHEFLTNIYITQVLPPRDLKVLTINTHYFLLKKCFYESQLLYFFRALDPVNWRFFLEAYQDSISNTKYGTFVLSCHPNTNADVRCRNFIQPNTGGIIYIPNTNLKKYSYGPPTKRI